VLRAGDGVIAMVQRNALQAIRAAFLKNGVRSN
jgi:hypothetical protein